MTEHTAYVKVMLDASIEEIWSLLRDFNGLPSYHPSIKTSRLERGDHESVGSIRYLVLENGQDFVREELLMLDDKAHAFEYAILDSSMPVKDYRAGVRLQFDAVTQQTACEWWADFEVTAGADSDALIHTIEEHVFKQGFLSAGEKIRAQRLDEALADQDYYPFSMGS